MAKEKDLQKIQQASGVTSDTTVRMVDASGNSVQIDRDVFVQAIRDVLPSVLSDQGTNATKVPTLNSSNVLGTSTIANLASVLGAGVSGNISSANLDNMKTNGNYRVTGAGWGLLTVEVFNSASIKQTRYYAADAKTEIRYCTNDTWGDWCRADSFGCSTPADLASLLGAPTWIALTSTSDLNDCYNVGATYFNDGANVTDMLNLPSNISRYFCVWTVRQGNSNTAANRYIQFCQDFLVNTSTNLISLYLRLRFPAGNWSKWNKISTTVHDE